MKNLLLVGSLCALTAFSVQAAETTDEPAGEEVSLEEALAGMSDEDIEALLEYLNAGGEDSPYENGQEDAGEADQEEPGDDRQDVTAFVAGDFYNNEVIKDENDAKAAIMSVIEKLGGDEKTVLEPLTIRPNEDGLSVYSFGQVEQDMAVYGATVKLIVDKDGHVCALSSSLVSGIEAEPIEDWAITEEEAEKIVLDNNKNKDLKIVEGATEQILLPVDTTESYYTWIVYTNNPDTSSETTYLAHYVDEKGEYIDSMPVIQPGDTDSLSAEGASLIFLDFEEDTWTGTVTKHDGTTKELTVPVLKDKETGERYLGDPNRKVLCIDYADFDYNDEINIRKEEDGRFADNELLIYDTFLRTYDLYKEAGWEGPDGEGTPVLLRMDAVEENGDVIENAAYTGKKHGYQCFFFNRNDPDGECTDIIAHEFTHCVTDNLMVYTRYYNQFGAMNEAFSDICGNIIEAIYGDSPDKTWLIQECGKPLRCMSDPKQFQQPSFVWDVYYLPDTDSIGGFSDVGGVHINSSLLNLIGYRLNEAGMPLTDQLYYWMNVILTMTSGSDYNALIQILPWCAETLGFSEYVPALENAIEETGIADLSLPETPAKGCGRIQFELPFTIDEIQQKMTVAFASLDDGSIYLAVPESGTNIVAATLPAGHYFTKLLFWDEDEQQTGGAVLTEDGWKSIESDDEIVEMLENRESISLCELNEGDISVVPAEIQATLLTVLGIE